MKYRTIQKTTGYDCERWTYIPVVVVGAGEAGVAMGCRLKEVLNFDQFRIFDRQSGVGGVWWINRYPGVACDVPAIFYSYSFSPKYGWSKFFPSGPEINKYLGEICNKYKLHDQIHLNCEVREAHWDEEEQLWWMTLNHMVTGAGDLSAYERQQHVERNGEHSVYIGTERIKAKCLISAVGGLVEPNIWSDEIPGKDTFKGEVFHSARWREDVDFNNKDVVVLGAGCSAAQFVPKLRKNKGAKSVTQVMRSPPYVIPRPTPPGGNDWWEKWSPTLSQCIPGFQWLMRKYIFYQTESTFPIYKNTKSAAERRRKIQDWVVAEMKKVAPTKYHEMLTPNYDVGCKRRIFDVEWLDSLNDHQTELTTAPLTSVQERSVTFGPGRKYPPMDDTNSNVPTDEITTVPADIIILANGFQTSKWLLPLKIKGRHGQNITDVFEERGGPQMYEGVALDDFPNFFALLGPNTGTGHSSALLAIENSVNLSLKLMAPVLRGEASTVEIKKEAELAYTAKLQSALEDTVWQFGGCESWYKDRETNWNGKSYPYSQIWYGIRCMFPTWSDWHYEYSKSAKIKKRLLDATKYSLVCMFAAAVYGARNGGLTETAAAA